MDKELQFKNEFVDLYAELDLNSLLDKIAGKICDYLNCEAASMFLYDSKKEELYFESATGAKQEELKKIVLKKGEGIVGWVAEHQKSEIINDCSRDSRFTAVTDKKTNFITNSILAVPVRMNGNFLGVLEAINKKKGIFDPKDEQLLQSMANFIAIPLQNAVLYKKLTVETNEKERLIELGKIVSHSFDLKEVFNTLKDIITEIIDPLEINVMVTSQDTTYQLIPQKQIQGNNKTFLETTISPNQVVFPLRVKDQSLGYMEIKAKKKIPDEIITLIRGISIYAAISIEKFEMHLQVLERERIEKELQIAKNIQRWFLPDEEKICLKGMEVAALNIPSSEVGGDYYDIIPISAKQAIFTINDISGHGIPASLPMSILSANFKYHVKRDMNILVTINHLNNLLAETTDVSQFVTSFTCCINLKRMKLRYINCGHHYPLVYRKETILELSEGETALGIFPDLPRTITEIEIETNDLIFLYTDGIIEAENSKGKQYTSQRLKEFMDKHKHHPVKTIKEKLIKELKRYVETDHFEDDVTFIIIRIL